MILALAGTYPPARVSPVTTRKIVLFASFRIQSNPLESKAKPTNIGIRPPLASGDVMPFSPLELIVFALRELVKI